jgi:hypothetical protein
MVLPVGTKKQGTPSAFQGKHAAFLEGWAERYRDDSRNKNTQEFWRSLFSQYWHNFPWRLPLTEDPKGEIVIQTEGWTAPVKPREELTPEEEIEKTELMKLTQKVLVFLFPSSGYR